MPDIYRPQLPPSPASLKHWCPRPEYPDQRPLGSIWQCAECSQYWFKSSTKGMGLLGNIVPGAMWSKVRWYHWGKKRLIAEHTSAAYERERLRGGASW